MRLTRFAWAAALVLALVACGEKESPSQQAMQKWVGVNAGELAVKTLDGEEQLLADVVMFEKKPVVLNVWATWCPPCLVEMPTLDALGKTGRYTVVAIATDREAQTVKDYLKKQDWGSGVQVWHDSLGAITREKLGALALPVTYVLSPDLEIVMVEAGERDWSHARMMTKIDRALQARQE